MEARASFDNLLQRLQALETEHASSQQQRQHSVRRASNDSLYTLSEIRRVPCVEALARVSQRTTEGGRVLIDARSGVLTPNGTARLAHFVVQTKEA